MQSLYTRIDKTRALLQPVPVDLHERRAAGHEEEDDVLAFRGISWNMLLFACALGLCLWTLGFYLLDLASPYLLAWLES